jgi:hypothetical protein
MEHVVQKMQQAAQLLLSLAMLLGAMNRGHSLTSLRNAGLERSQEEGLTLPLHHGYK